MYKSSKYNIEIKKFENGEILYYNSFTGAVCVLDSLCLDILNNIATVDTQNYNIEQQQRLKSLIDHGFVINQDFDELNWIIIRNRGLRYNLDSKRMRLTIAPTMGCNFNCYYCYESRAEKCKKMSEETVNDLVNYIEKKIKYGNLSVLNISWYGGEPLLELDTIIRISDQLVEMCNNNNIHYHADILTNGFLLTKEVANLLKNRCRIEDAQIPMDGMAEIYSKRKGVKLEVFDQVVNNICDVSDIMNIHIRMNIDKENEEEIRRLTKYLLIDQNLKEKVRVYLAALKNYENVCDFMGEACYTSDEFFKCHNDFYKYLYCLGVENSILKAIPAPRWISCGLSQVNGLVIDPEGYLYRCAHLIGHKKNSVGHLKTDQVFNDENMRFLNVNHHDKCLKCQLFPTCMGGCVFERMLNDDTPVCRDTYDRLRNDISLAYSYLI